MQPKKLLLIRIIVGIVFILSTVSKLKSPRLFEIILIDQGFTSDRLTAAYLSRILISLELFIGVAFLQPFLLKKVVAPLTIFLLTAFSIYLLFLMTFAGDTENCGCFGDVIKMSPLESLVKNIALIGLVSYLFIREESKQGKWLLPVVLFIGSFLWVFTAFSIHAIEENVFARYTQFEGEGRVDLTQGDRLVAVMDVNCKHCQAVAQELAELDNNSKSLPPIYFLIYSEDEGVNSIEYFFYLTSTDYPYHMIGEDEFFDLIGNAPPRIYWLKDGKIKAQWDENITANMTNAFKNE